MIRHNIKFSLRALKRHSGYVFINVLGLTIGIACALIIALFIIYELSYDRYNPHRSVMYWVNLHGMMSGQEMRMAYTASPVGPAMADEFPEVEDFLRMHIWDETILQAEDRIFAEPHFALADSIILAFLALLIAPLIYWIASNWLQNYHYRISMQPGDFLLGFAVAVMIALTTISYRVIHSASVNPAESMRYEQGLQSFA